VVQSQRGTIAIGSIRKQGASHINKVGFKGVTFEKRRFRAQITKDDKQYHLGYFATPEAAHAAYVEAAKRLHGEFARGS
jgi:AP2 domain